jgi:hypothetical protein
VGDDRHVFGEKFPDEKGSVRWCVVMMQQPALLSPEFREKSSHIFMKLQFLCTLGAVQIFIFVVACP